MRITSYINNVKCLEWGLNLAQGALFDLLNQVQSWAEPVYVDGEVFYWVSRQMIIKEIPVAYTKPDTVYRALKFLAESGLINYIKHGNKDCINLTSKGKEWNSEINPSQLGNKSEKGSKLGNKSEKTRKKIRKDSEINPTYKTTNNQTTNDQNNNTASPKDRLIASGVDKQVLEDYLAVRKAKRSPLTHTAIDRLETEARKASLDLAEVVRICAERSWVGFNANWNVNTPANQQPPIQNFNAQDYGKPVIPEKFRRG